MCSCCSAQCSNVIVLTRHNALSLYAVARSIILEEVLFSEAVCKFLVVDSPIWTFEFPLAILTLEQVVQDLDQLSKHILKRSGKL